jgi:hypothetical protein
MLIGLITLAIVVAFFLLERTRPELINALRENFLAILLATITIVSFFQVIARYGFNTGWGGALEFTRILFAWLILFGMSYGVKTGMHLGVDALIRCFPKPAVQGSCHLRCAVRRGSTRDAAVCRLAAFQSAQRKSPRRRRASPTGRRCTRSASASMTCVIRSGCRRPSACRSGCSAGSPI